MVRGVVWASVAVGIGAVIASTHALASGFAVRENCTEGLSTIYAGEASLADSPCTVFNNPAGMTRLDGTQIEFGATPIFPTINFHGTDTAGGNTGNNAGRPVLVPNLYAVTKLTPELSAGLAVTAPFGLPVKYNSAWAGRYLVIQGQALTTDVNPNVAYKINDKLSVGGGLSAQYLTFTLSQGINQTGLLGTPTNDGLARFKGDNWAFGYNFGLLYEPLPGTRVGLTYRSKVEHKLSGDQDFGGIAAPLGAFFPSSPATVDIALPATTALSLTHDVTPALTLAWELQYTQWSAFKGVGINGAVTAYFNESYTDSWFTSLAAIYRLNDTWTLRGGIGWDQSPVQDRYRDVGVPDQDRYMVGAGFGYALNPMTSIDFAYAHYFAAHASMNNSINNTDPITGTVLNGTYQLSLDFVSASVRFKF